MDAELEEITSGGVSVTPEDFEARVAEKVALMQALLIRDRSYACGQRFWYHEVLTKIGSIRPEMEMLHSPGECSMSPRYASFSAPMDHWAGSLM